MAKSPTRSAHAPAPKTSVEGAARIEAITVQAFDRKDGTGADFSLIVESLFRAGFKMLDGLPEEADRLRIAEKVHAAAYGRFLATEAGREGDTKGQAQPTNQKPGASPALISQPRPNP